MNIEPELAVCEWRGCNSPPQLDAKYCVEHQTQYDTQRQLGIDQQRIITMRNNELLVRDHTLKTQADKVKRQVAHQEAVAKFNPMLVAETDIDNVISSIDIKAEAVRRRLPFIGAPSGEFTQRVPFYGGNLILICAMTGHGKTTVMSAIVHALIENGRRPLVMTNETSQREFFIALACLKLGFSYGRKFAQLSADQIAEVKAEIRELMKKVIVVDQLSVPGGTTSVSGLQVVLDKVSEAEQKPDAILLDYLQGISEGFGPADQAFEVQHDAGEVLWNFIVRSGIPVVAFSQLHPKDKSRRTLEDRIKLGRHILTRVTYAIEYIPDYKTDPQNPRAQWRPWKIREMAEAAEMDMFYTDFNGGKFGEPRRIEDILLAKMNADEEKELRGASKD